MLHSHQRAFDARLEHRAVSLAALTADATIATFNQKAQTRTQYVTIIRLESCKVSAGNEEYRFIMECSNDGFTTVETAAITSLGATGARLGGGPDNAAGDEYHIPWETQVNGQSFKDWRIRLEVAGTAPSVGFSMNSTC